MRISSMGYWATAASPTGRAGPVHRRTRAMLDRSPVRRHLAVLGLVTLTAGAACGAGGNGAPNAGRNGTRVTLGAASNVTSPANTVTTEAGTKFCADAATDNLLQQIQANATANPAQDSSALQKDLSLLQRYEADAPAAVQPDIATLVRWYGKLVQVSGEQHDYAKLAQDVQGLGAD